MCLILLVAAISFAAGASRGDAAQSRLPTRLLAVDSLWSTGGRATGPATRTPAGGPGRSRPAPWGP
jgi:hypothetical protein